MKNLCVFLLFFVASLTALAQGTSTRMVMTAPKVVPLDKSPMDMVYFPMDYPVLKIQDKIKEPLVARVIYSRPLKNNRPLFGDLIEYGKIWRLGANEATELELYRDVKIGGKKVPKGRYTLYAIINPDTWTMILNKETDTWGSFKYDEKKDVVRLNVPVVKTQEVSDAFSLWFDKTDNGMNMMINWDDVKVALPIALK